MRPCRRRRISPLQMLFDFVAGLMARGGGPTVRLRVQGSPTKPRLGTPRGERVATAKATAAMVVEIRRAWAQSTSTQQELAAKYGLRQSTISAIVTRFTWRHVAVTVEEEQRAEVKRVEEGEVPEQEAPVDTGTGRIQQLGPDGAVLATFADIRRAEVCTGVDRLDIARALNERGPGWRYEPGAAPLDVALHWGDAVPVRLQRYK